MTRLLIIQLWPVYSTCHVCDIEHLGDRAIAVYEDAILPDDYQGEWFGASVCDSCFAIVDRLQRARPGKVIYFGEVRREIKT